MESVKRLSIVFILSVLSAYGQFNIYPAKIQPKVGAFSQLINTMNLGIDSVGISVYGDSTGNDTTEWVYLLSSWLAAKYPAYTVNYYLYVDASNGYGNPTVIQTGTAGDRYANFTGVRSMSVPAARYPAITGDVDIAVKIDPSTWRPGANMEIIAHYGAAGQRSFRMMLLTGGQLYWQTSADGTTLSTTSQSTVAMASNTSGATWVRVTHDVNNGVAGNTVKFYYGTSGTSWTQLGADVVNVGTTSIFNSTYDWEIGARGTSSPSEPFTGKIYAVKIMDATGVYPTGPQSIDAWQTGIGTTPLSETIVGAPVLSILNGSIPGAGLSTFSNATRMSYMSLDYDQTTAILSVSHNEAAATGPAELTIYGTVLSGIKTALPFANVIVFTQNPRTSPANNVREHSIRRKELLGWCMQNKYSIVDAFSGFYLDSRGLAALVNNSDGIHPTTDGSALWANIIERVIMADQ